MTVPQDLSFCDRNAAHIYKRTSLFTKGFSDYETIIVHLLIILGKLSRKIVNLVNWWP
jgi:hypothetical protein